MAYPMYCCGFAFTTNLLQVLLIEKIKPEWQKGLLNGIGGKIESGEHSVDAMTREFFEESGIMIPVLFWKPVCILTGLDYDRDPVWKVAFFATRTDAEWEQRTDEKIARFLVQQLPTWQMIPNLNWLIPMAINMLRGKDKTALYEIIELPS